MKMKKCIALTLFVTMCLALVGCGTTPPANSPSASTSTGPKTSAPATSDAPKAFEPAAQGEWIVTYNPGSGSDLFTRAVATAFQEGNITKANLPVVNKSEGAGIVGIQYVANITNQEAANNTLITLGGGDISEAVRLTNIKADSIVPIAVMASELPMLVKSKDCRFKDFNEAIADMKAGKQVILCGPQNDYEVMAQKLREVLGVTEKELTYIPFESGKEGITNLMGNHADFAFCTPAHAGDLVTSGDIIPEWIYHTEHYQYGPLVDLPTLKEFTNGQYENLSNPIYRLVAASSKMSPEAQAYWADCLKKATDTDYWKDYCSKYSLSTSFLTGDDARDKM